MGKRFFLSFAAFVLCALSLMAYPTIEMGGLYKGLDQTEMKSNPPKYVFQKFMSEEEYRQLFPLKNEENQEIETTYNSVIVHRTNGVSDYVRLADKTGKTYWKTSALQVPFDDEEEDEGGDSSPELGKPFLKDEYFRYVYAIGNDVLLVDRKTKNYVIKQENGIEHPLPLNMKSYAPTAVVNCDAHPLSDNYYLTCMGSARPFELAIVSGQGVMKGWCKTDIKVGNIRTITRTVKQDRLLIKYEDLQGQCGLMIISTDGKLVKNYPNYYPGVIRFDYQAPDYILPRDARGPILNTETGEMAAFIQNTNIALTQIGDKLIALVDKSGAIAVIDILNAKLIQDFTDFGKPPEPRRVYTIGLLHISADAKDIYFERCYKDKASEILYYRIKE